MSVITLEELRDKLTRWSVVAPQACKKALTEGAETVRREVQEKHLSGPRMPRGVGDPTDATLQPISNTLRRSITKEVTVKPGEVSAIIGTNVVYAARHEFGYESYTKISRGFGTYLRKGTTPARPFMRPSLAAKREEVFQKLRVRLFESYKTGAA